MCSCVMTDRVGLVAVFDLPVEELYDNHESDDDCIMTGGLKRKFGV